jgi:hypothetical protein
MSKRKMAESREKREEKFVQAKKKGTCVCSGDMCA